MKQFKFYRYIFLIIGAAILYLIVNRFQDSWNLSHTIAVPDYPAFPTTNINALIPSRQPVEPIILTPVQDNCPNGFYYFENTIYGICYPNMMTAYNDNSVSDPISNGYQKNVVSFTKNGEVISIIPHFVVLHSTNLCIIQEHIKISGFNAVRDTLKSTALSGCSDTTIGITTMIDTGEKYPFSILYYAFGDGGGKLQYVNNYSTIEKSLTIKK